MTFSRFLYGALCLALVLVGCAHDSQIDDPSPLAPPASVEPLQAGPATGDCSRMTKQYMSTTTDLGQSFVPYPTPVQRTLSLTWGLAALDDAGTLVMQADDELWGSENDGCSWVQIRGTVDTKGNRLSTGPTPAAEGIFRVTAAGQGYAYAWQDNGGRIIRVHHGNGQQTRWESIALRAPISNMKGFGVDAVDPMHVRTAGNDGQIFESFDGGISWAPIGVAASRGIPLGYVIAFDANDLDHAVYGRVIEGGYVTFDGGASWTQSAGLASVAGASVNLFNAVISPLDGNTVFAMALDLAESGAGAPSQGRHIYASTDGGLSFVPVLDHLSDGVLLSNGPVMLCNPDDANRLIFLSSSSPVFGGTTFYDYDLAGDLLQSVHNDAIPKVRALIHSRVDPSALHAGFDWF